MIAVLLSAGCGSDTKWLDRTYTRELGSESDGDTAAASGGDSTASSPRTGQSGGKGAAGDNGGSAGKGGSRVNSANYACDPAEASEHLPQRGSITAGGEGVFVRDLFGLFQSNCGACHVDQNQGNWHVTKETFASYVFDSLDRMQIDDPELYMPPPSAGGKPWSEREGNDTDPIVELAALLEAWDAAGYPADVFYPSVELDEDDTDDTGDTTSSPYRMEPDVAIGMTNLGNCVPDKAMVGMESNMAQTLDEMFAKATELPDRLVDTDLFTLDAALLARRGVVAYAPAYTLWADNAKKVRMVRVPRGRTIAFDPDTQSFDVPPNTRFYKTFLKRVIDLDGNESYRKMETRLIVSRPDLVLPDGSRKPQALFGTYAWNSDETEARLVRDPLRNGEPFRDRMVQYIFDERAAYDVVSKAPDDLEDALYHEDADETKQVLLTRTYAIPGSERCIQCHMGAPNASFVLGFTPLQLHRQPKGKQGVIEPAERDELNQLQRMLEYGIISGMSSPSEVTLLAQSQGSRKPRNDYELEAQGYALGNCAHCHNPVGFPSVSAPELRDVLDLQPSARGGMFQFPLDRFSPRVFRGPTQQTRIPYITPSLYDLGEVPLGEVVSGSNPMQGYTKKVDNGEELLDQPFYVHAPWRSIMYRNVDTPFSYVDDFAIFPHMPRHTPGYDCRARQLFGTWMTSIPSRPTDGFFDGDEDEAVATTTYEQPYVEVSADEQDYERALEEADRRVKAFQNSPRYDDCPKPEFDVVDPVVRDDPMQTAPPDTFVDNDKMQYSLPVPSREHWFVSDLTDTPGDWEPRRADWKAILIDRDESQMRGAEEKQTVELLDELRLTDNEDLRTFALTPVEFGVWAEGGKGCTFPASVKTVAESLMDTEHPRWMDGTPDYKPNPAGRVYSISPGGQVFATICRSCHGPEADSRSRLADTIADLTGGDTRVANLRDGLFGPTDLPGQNIQSVFGEPATMLGGISAQDLAARYLAWMALGGTQRTIPPAIIQLVSINYVLGEKRGGYRNIESGSANMLETARFLCAEVLPQNSMSYYPDLGVPITPQTERKLSAALVYSNGDAEMWVRMCTFQNPLPVRALTVSETEDNIFLDISSSTIEVEVDGLKKKTQTYNLFKRAGYGANPVGDHTGQVQAELTDANRAPWCILEPPATRKDKLDALWADKRGAVSPPYCPPGLISEENRLQATDVEAWKKRGAMNAGLAAFLYMDALANKTIQRVPDYDRCEELGQ